MAPGETGEYGQEEGGVDPTPELGQEDRVGGGSQMCPAVHQDSPAICQGPGNAPRGAGKEAAIAL